MAGNHGGAAERKGWGGRNRVGRDWSPRIRMSGGRDELKASG
jgi:hypothetical protein